MKTDKSIVNAYITKGETKKAITYLFEVIDKDHTHYPDLVNISSRFNRFTKEKQNGILDDNYYTLEINKINLLLVNFGEEEVELPIFKKEKTYGKYMLGFIILVIVLGIGLWYINFNTKKSINTIIEKSSKLGVEKEIKPPSKKKEVNIFPLTIDYFIGDYTGGNLTIGNNTEHIVLIKNLKVIWDYSECLSFKQPIAALVVVEYNYKIDLTKSKGEKIIDKREFKYSKGEIEKFNIDIKYPDTGVYTIWVGFEYKIFGNDSWQDYKSQKDIIEKCSKL
ncbi:hypothetical protein KO494_03930 [Lacinutrix sp. C3R15]|uniref:hypothetical protein n=1 Tax=Flavobacteriaceae TaxID=49546 RepID=UPI001C08BF5F|nr:MULTISPECIES: hypothetical protein [Flavobacteriaceae]MBU2938684.1 hypothetical protein [Lacinutrix sp. C3R15]MDO6621998.1 hypothetical protein [Oceanihabitans sp. 1_MG-2023]